jgi:hypothetical protein
MKTKTTTTTLTEDMIRELGVITTCDEAGRHFTKWSRHYEELEALGLLKIHRPQHAATGVDYAPEYWTVEVTAEGEQVVEAHPELWPDAE